MTIALDHASPGLVPPPWAPDCWGEQDQAELVCRTVLEITHDVKTFMFEPIGDKVFHFEPGQFITLQLEIDGQPISRCYTISSPPTRPHLIAITVKRVIGGPVSNWLHDNVAPGTRITVLAPLGQFTLSGPPAPKYLFLSAGSGITPVMSMTRTLFDLGSDADIVFVHAARTPADIIFRRELEAIAAVMPNIRVVHICEGDYPSERWMGLRGRLTTAALQAIAPDLAERVTYTCGPPAYMAAVRRVLGEAGYDMANYHEESFAFDSLPGAEQARRRSAAPGRRGRATPTPPTARPAWRPSASSSSAAAAPSPVPAEPVRPRRRAGRRPAAAVVLHPGHVRHLQDRHARRVRSTCSTTAASGPRRSRRTRSSSAAPSRSATCGSRLESSVGPRPRDG